MKKKEPAVKNTAKSKVKKSSKKTVKKTNEEPKKKLKSATPATSKKKTEKTTKKLSSTKAKPANKKQKIAEKETKKTTKKTKEPAKKKVSAKKVTTKRTAVAAEKTSQRNLAKVKKGILEESTYPVITQKGLPVEYGEDKVTLMTVDPWKLFAYWEIKKATASSIRGTMVIRVYDVTGISNFDGKNAGIVFDIPIFARIGDSYIGAGPGRDFIIDIGVITQSKEFIMFARSNRVSTPALRVSEKEGAIPGEIFEAAPRVGY